LIPRLEGSVEVFSYDPYWDYLIKSDGVRRFEYKEALFPFQLSDKLSFMNLTLPPPVEETAARIRAARRLDQYLFSLEGLAGADVPRADAPFRLPAKKRHLDVTHKAPRRVIFLL
jgi:hypothetical protein